MYYGAVVQGVVMGCIYGLTTLGVNIIFGIMKIVNWANNSLLMVSMYIIFGVVTLTGTNPYVAMLVAAPIMFCFGWAFQHTVIRPLYRRETEKNPYGLLLCTAGLGIALENITLMLLKSTPRTIKMGITQIYVDVGFGASVSLVKIIGAVIAVATTATLWAFMSKSYAGRALRSTAQDRDAARLMGINVMRYYDLAFGIGCGICAIAGCVYSTFYQITPSSGATVGHKAFIILVLGGIESVPGCLLAGVLLGVVEAVGAMLFNSYIGEMLCFVVFVLVLFFRPNGLFGRRAR
ncbi:branched-chain amino acid ABC transporter permease [Feifania hominis]|uniref:branched-chain amino acid ABC transporter permease n=1 Tax=Feifania hominis TaxID=2763660 RepID=UPI002016197A